MKLKTVQVTDFHSVKDSTPFDVGDITCLVGKNEAGKTAILQALHRLNPLDKNVGTFSVTDDYPRSEVSDYEQAVTTGKRQPATAVTATFVLSDAEKQLVEEDFGAGVIKSGVLTLKRGYYETTYVALDIDEAAACKNLVARAELPPSSVEKVGECKTLDDLESALGGAEQDEHIKRLAALVSEIKNEQGFKLAAYTRHLKARVPHFLYLFITQD